MGKALVILAIGLFGIYMGVVSYNGYGAKTQHVYRGEEVELTCDDHGDPASGPGLLSASARRACQRERKSQKDRTPYWIAAGAVFAYVGATSIKKIRAAG
jgi:hypothetical protein